LGFEHVAWEGEEIVSLLSAFQSPGLESSGSITNAVNSYSIE